MGRPKSTDPRKPLPFRLKGSVIQVAKEIGRDETERRIAGDKDKQPTS